MVASRRLKRVSPLLGVVQPAICGEHGGQFVLGQLPARRQHQMERCGAGFVDLNVDPLGQFRSDYSPDGGLGIGDKLRPKFGFGLCLGDDLALQFRLSRLRYG